MSNAIASNNDLTGVLGVASSAQTTANTAQSTATTAQTTANTAQTTANTAQTTANNAQTTANNANALANQINNDLFGGTISGGHTTWSGGGGGITISGGAFFNMSGNTTSLSSLNVSGAITAGTKDFWIADPADPTKGIRYASVEAPKVTLQDSGTAQLVNGQVTVTMDPTFSRVTEGALMAVATATGDCKGLYIASVAVDRSSFTVKECQGGTSNVSLNWMAWATRSGFTGRAVVTDTPPPG